MTGLELIDCHGHEILVQDCLASKDQIKELKSLPDKDVNIGGDIMVRERAFEKHEFNYQSNSKDIEDSECTAPSTEVGTLADKMDVGTDSNKHVNEQHEHDMVAGEGNMENDKYYMEEDDKSNVEEHDKNNTKEDDKSDIEEDDRKDTGDDERNNIQEDNISDIEEDDINDIEEDDKKDIEEEDLTDAWHEMTMALECSKVCALDCSKNTIFVSFDFAIKLESVSQQVFFLYLLLLLIIIRKKREKKIVLTLCCLPASSRILLCLQLMNHLVNVGKNVITLSS